MKGLLLKDLFVLKKTGRVFMMLILLYVVMALFMHTDFGVLVAFITGMLSITSFAYDEQAKWDAFALTMPLTKRNIVNSKYLLTLMLGAMGAVVGLLLSIASGIGKGAVDLPGILANSGLALCATYVFGSIAMPLLYKLGAEKSRIVLMLCYTVPIIGASILLSWLEDASVTMPQILSAAHTAAILLPFFTVAVLAISYKISLAVFEKKDV